MKMSKAERKAYNLGRQVGRAEGYAAGLHDGNPFNALVEATSRAISSMADRLSDPEFIEYLKALKAEAAKVKEEEEEEGFKWIKVFENPFTNGYKCPVCGYQIQVTENFINMISTCNNCGAEMVGVTEEKPPELPTKITTG